MIYLLLLDINNRYNVLLVGVTVLPVGGGQSTSPLMSMSLFSFQQSVNK